MLAPIRALITAPGKITLIIALGDILVVLIHLRSAWKLKAFKAILL